MSWNIWSHLGLPAMGENGPSSTAKAVVCSPVLAAGCTQEDIPILLDLRCERKRDSSWSCGAKAVAVTEKDWLFNTDRPESWSFVT